MSFKKSCVWLLAFLFLLSSIMSGCSSFTMGYERYYKGELKPLSKIAIIIPISVPEGYATDSWINYIDGVKAKEDIRLGITFPSVRELNPGKHIICTSYQKRIPSYGYNTSKGCLELHLNAKPGQVYLIYPLINTHDNNWQPAYWNITGDLHTSELKELVETIDKALTEKRGGNPVSILSLATKQNTSPLIGFGEKHKSSLKRWLNKDITVLYEFYRYEPNIIVEADNGVEYHLKIDQKTGNVSSVLGKDVDVARGFFQAFQPLNSKFAYSYFEDRQIQPVWEELKDGSFIMVKDNN